MRKLFIGLFFIIVLITLWNSLHPVINSTDYYIQEAKKQHQHEIPKCSMCNSNRRYTL